MGNASDAVVTAAADLRTRVYDVYAVVASHLPIFV